VGDAQFEMFCATIIALPCISVSANFKAYSQNLAWSETQVERGSSEKGGKKFKVTSKKHNKYIRVLFLCRKAGIKTR